jgi:hypothetical protein
MISPCAEPGCSMLSMGLFCIAHAPKPDRVFPRGRPWPPITVLKARDAAVLAPLAAVQAASLTPAQPTA